MADNVKPSHYKAGKYECINVMIAIFGKKAVQIFCILNAFKYIFRFQNKNGLEDVKKARWYISKYIELEEEKDDRSDGSEV